MLELASTEDLLRELKNRYTALIVLGCHAEDMDRITEVIEGPMYMVAGLLTQATCEMTASMTRPLDEE